MCDCASSKQGCEGCPLASCAAGASGGDETTDGADGFDADDIRSEGSGAWKPCDRRCRGECLLASGRDIGARFLLRVDLSDPDGCWEWVGGKVSTGYGSFRGRPAHRVALELKSGPISDELFACHACDNRPCVRPCHLAPMTQRENLRDMVRKGRGRTRLSDEQVRELWRRSNAGETLRQLAAEFGVSHHTIHMVRNRRRYLHLWEAEEAPS